jgi:hypothetical protein
MGNARSKFTDEEWQDITEKEEENLFGRKILLYSDETQIIINKSGFYHAPFLVTWINAHEQCGADILTRKELKSKYDV